MTRNQRRWHRAVWLVLLPALAIVLGAAMRARSHGTATAAGTPPAHTSAVKAP